MKRIRIPMTLALGAALTIAPLSFASAEENPAPKMSQTTTAGTTAADVGLNVNLDVLGIAKAQPFTTALRMAFGYLKMEPLQTKAMAAGSTGPSEAGSTGMAALSHFIALNIEKSWRSNAPAFLLHLFAAFKHGGFDIINVLAKLMGNVPGNFPLLKERLNFISDRLHSLQLHFQLLIFKMGT